MNAQRWIVLGCALFLNVAGARGEEPPTFARDVAPLLYTKCAACHQPGGLAPFSVVEYAEARKQAGKLAQVTRDRAMPPWLPLRGEFAHGRSIDEKEVAMLRRWAEAGAPEGDAAQLPPTPKLSDDWSLGKPDVVLTVPKAFSVAPEGRTVTAHFVFPLGLTEDRHLRAVEILPGNAKVVQSARVLFDRSGRARELAGTAGQYERFGGPGFFPSGEMASQGPGQLPQILPQDAGVAVGPDTDLVLQVRYRPAGEGQTDVSRVGLYFAKAAPARVRSGVYLGNETLALTPQTKRQVARDEVTLAVALEATDVRPNLLLFGTALRAWAETPDGKKISLLEIADWNHAWQETYRLAQPVRLPKGTKIKVLWEFDNKSDAIVRVGDGPEGEAPALWLGGVAGSWEEHLLLNGANLLHSSDLRKPVRKRP